jgi:hypothetical protein
MTWQPYQPCPCGCEVVGWKLQRVLSGDDVAHVVGCSCRRHIAKRSVRKGKAAQAKGHRNLGGSGFTPHHEESRGGYDVRVQVEHKAGQQVPAAFRRFLATEWFRRALGQAERAARIGDGSLPAVMVDGRWLVVDCQPRGKGNA